MRRIGGKRRQELRDSVDILKDIIDTELPGMEKTEKDGTIHCEWFKEQYNTQDREK